jgi:hypothetical protein
MQLYRLYLFIRLCKGFLMMNKFKILLVYDDIDSIKNIFIDMIRND